jgi:hypothetical protein
MQIQVGTPTADPGTIAGGTVAGTNDEANTICFEIRPSAPPAANGGILKTYSGSFAQKVLKQYNGATWEAAVLKAYNGTTWETVDTTP